MDCNITAAFILTLLAGLATGIGSIISLFTSRTNRKFLSAALGFSAGVMLYISFAEMFVKSNDYLRLDFGNITGTWAACASLFGGMVLIMLIDNLIPSPESNLTAVKTGQHDAVLQRMGLFMAL